MIPKLRMNQLEYIEFDFGKVTKVSNQIIFTEFYSNDNFDVGAAKLIDEARFKLANGKKFLSLASLVNVFGHMTKEAQIFFANDSQCKDLIKHEVLLVDSLSIRILVKYYIKWIKPPYNIEVTKNYDDGLKKLSKLLSA